MSESRHPGADAQTGRGPGRLATLATKASLWLVAICSVACFLIITFMRPTTWYSTNIEFTYIRNNMTIDFPGDVPVPTKEVVGKNGKITTTLIGRDSPLWAGSTGFPVSLQWGSVMMAALATAGLQFLARMEPSRPLQLAPASPSRLATPTSTVAALLASLHSMTSTAWRKVRHVFSLQISPVRFWSWWCGGLSVLDLLLVMVWCGLTVTYLYYLISRKFENTAISLTPPPAPPPSPPVLSPPPLPANATAPPAARVVDLMSPLFMAKRLDNCAKAFGEVLRMSMMMMFLPISRSHFMKWLLGTDYPTLIKYHRWMSWGTILLVFVHSVLYMIEWGANGELGIELSWETLGAQRNVCGLIATLASLVIAFTATSWFRQTYFWLFYRVHMGGFLIFIIFALMHYKALINWIMPGLVLYGIDRAFRLWQLFVNWTRVGPEDVAMDGSMLTLRLNFVKVEGKTIAPGQTVYLRCPAISLLNSHPFDVADITHTEDGVTHVIVHMTVRGPWTTALRSKIMQGSRLRMQVEGPYETSIDRLTPTPVVVMVAGGIGVTPLLGLLRHYLRLATSTTAGSASTVPRVYFVWSSRSLSDLKLLGHDLLAACTHTATGAGSPATPHGEQQQQQQQQQQPGGTLAAPHSTVSASAKSLVAQIGNSMRARDDGWLHAALHYTGFELEQKQGSVEVTMPFPDGSAAALDKHNNTLDKNNSLDKATPTGDDTFSQLLSTHPTSNPLVYTNCILLGFFGAWAGMLTASYYDGYYARTTAEGADYLTVANVEWVCIAAGAVCPPLVFLALRWAAMRLWRSKDGAPKSEASQSDADSSDGAASDSSVSKVKQLANCLYSTLTVLPGYVMAPFDTVTGTWGAGVALGRGRPDVTAVIKAVLDLHADMDEVQVLVAGSDSLAEPVLQLCAQHNCGLGKGPTLVFKRVAHHN